MDTTKIDHNIATLYTLRVCLAQGSNQTTVYSRDEVRRAELTSRYFAKVVKRLASAHGRVLVYDPRPEPGPFAVMLNRVISGMIELGWAEERLAASPYVSDRRLAERLAGVGE